MQDSGGGSEIHGKWAEIRQWADQNNTYILVLNVQGLAKTTSWPLNAVPTTLGQGRGRPIPSYKISTLNFSHAWDASSPNVQGNSLYLEVALQHNHI